MGQRRSLALLHAESWHPTNGSAVNEPVPSPARRRLRLLALAVAAVCVVALAAGAFALSYQGARATAVNAGVAVNLARIYPGIFDAVLLVACAAALSLRGAWRVCAWLAILVVIGTVAAADAAHAISVVPPKRPMEAAAALVPWAMLLVGFTLLYAIARQGRPARNAVPPVGGNGHGAQPSRGAATVPLNALLGGEPARLAGLAPAVKPAPPGAAQQAGRPFQPGSVPGTRPAALPATQPAALPTGKDATKPSAAPASPPARKQAAGAAALQAGRTAAGPARQPHQAQGGKATGAQPSTLPAPAAPEAGGRDEPSEADAGPSEPSMLFGRLHRSPLAPEEPAGNGEPQPAGPAASEPAQAEAAASQSAPAEAAASKPPPAGATASKPPPAEVAAGDPSASKEPAVQFPEGGGSQPPVPGPSGESPAQGGSAAEQPGSAGS